MVTEAEPPDGPEALNSGGYQTVVYVGIASPIKTPLIGTPRPLL